MRHGSVSSLLMLALLADVPARRHGARRSARRRRDALRAQDGRGTVWIGADGAVIGRFDSGTLTITDPATATGRRPVVRAPTRGPVALTRRRRSYSGTNSASASSAAATASRSTAPRDRPLGGRHAAAASRRRRPRHRQLRARRRLLAQRPRHCAERPHPDRTSRLSCFDARRAAAAPTAALAS